MTQASAASATSSSARPIKVLVVDDDPVLLRMVQTFLLSSDDPYEVLLANSGAEALELARSEIPDLVLLDLMMPEMDGYTLTAEVRNDPRLNRLHIMLHTSLSGVFNQAMVKKVGADDFLAKFKPDDLAQRVIARLHLLREGGAGEG